jgi:hypothetical protein
MEQPEYNMFARSRVEEEYTEAGLWVADSLQPALVADGLLVHGDAYICACSCFV